MKKSILICALVLSPIIFMSLSSLNENYFKIGSNSWSIDTAVIANESYGDQSKYEIDLFNGDINSETFIYLSVSGDKSTELSSGIYNFGNIKEQPTKFHGQVVINKNSIDITEGSFIIEKENANWNIECMLKLKNGDIVKGSYKGKTIEKDRNMNYQK